MIFCSCSFSLMFYGINFLRPASGYFLYLVSKGRSAGCARNDNSVSFHHAMFAHQCRNSEKYGINEGGNLAASKIRNLECPNYEICLIDYGCGKFNRKIHIMEQYP